MEKLTFEWYRQATPEELLEIDNSVAYFIGQDDDSNVDFGNEWWEWGNDMPAYTADFETTTDEDDCRVWAAGICEIGGSREFTHGNTIAWFFKQCRDLAPCTMYFHNLGFDGAFIMDWLERHGWRWVAHKDDAAEKTYTTVISDMNQVYCIEIFFGTERSVRIMDSFKIAPLSVAKLAKAYDLPMLKGSIDYEAPRPIGHELTDEEVAYLENDVRITALVMEKFLAEGLDRMTAGSNALSFCKEQMGGKDDFRMNYPELTKTQDDFIRRAYRGGFAYVNPDFQGRELGEGIVFDVNSLYPSVMYDVDGTTPLPYGEPVYFAGEPKNLGSYPLWVAEVECAFTLRDGFLPTVQLKSSGRFADTEYIADSRGAITLTVTNVDWDLMCAHYHVRKVDWHGGYLFKSSSHLLRPYIDRWTKVKVDATRSGNSGLRQIAKLMLNSLYGKFATRMEVLSRRPTLVNDVLRYVDLPAEEREGVYLPVAVFTTSYARAKTIRAAQSVKDRFAYADTDSLHLLGTDVPSELEIDDADLGKWKHESTFERAKFLRPKCYIEHECGKDKPTVRCAGMPASMHSQVTMDNFEFGAVYHGKLYTHRVYGGIVLSPGDMELKA